MAERGKLTVSEKKRSYRFHNPNTAEAAGAYLLKIFIEADKNKVEEAVREEAEYAAGEKEER